MLLLLLLAEFNLIDHSIGDFGLLFVRIEKNTYIFESSSTRAMCVCVCMFAFSFWYKMLFVTLSCLVVYEVQHF